MECLDCEDCGVATVPGSTRCAYCQRQVVLNALGWDEEKASAMADKGVAASLRCKGCQRLRGVKGRFKQLAICNPCQATQIRGLE